MLNKQLAHNVSLVDIIHHQILNDRFSAEIDNANFSFVRCGCNFKLVLIGIWGIPRI